MKKPLSEQTLGTQLIKIDVDRLKSQIVDLAIEHNKEKTVLEKKIKELQDYCQHLDKTHYPDPSGNNDSHYQCNICGKEGKKL